MRIGCFKDNSCPVQNPLQSVPAKGRGTIPSSIQVLHVLSMKQEITSKEFSSLRTVKDTAEGFTKPFLQEYVVIFCIVRPNPNSVKKLFSSKECRTELKWVLSVWVLLIVQRGCGVYFFLASPCMSALLSNRWLGLARLLSAEDKGTLSYPSINVLI